jgi:hypothetical protein
MRRVRGIRERIMGLRVPPFLMAALLYDEVVTTFLSDPPPIEPRRNHKRGLGVCASCRLKLPVHCSTIRHFQHDYVEIIAFCVAYVY